MWNETPVDIIVRHLSQAQLLVLEDSRNRRTGKEAPERRLDILQQLTDVLTSPELVRAIEIHQARSRKLIDEVHREQNVIWLKRKPVA